MCRLGPTVSRPKKTLARHNRGDRTHFLLHMHGAIATPRQSLQQGPSDVPVLSHMLDTARQILSSASTAPSSDTERASVPDIRVGFVGTITRKSFQLLTSSHRLSQVQLIPGDPQSPHKHLHAHAMAGPVDTSLPGAGFYRRNVVFGSMNWWSIEDLRAEIR